MLLDAFPISEATTFPSRYLTVCVGGGGEGMCACEHVVECGVPELVPATFSG